MKWISYQEQQHSKSDIQSNYVYIADIPFLLQIFKEGQFYGFREDQNGMLQWISGKEKPEDMGLPLMILKKGTERIAFMSLGIASQGVPHPLFYLYTRENICEEEAVQRTLLQWIQREKQQPAFEDREALLRAVKKLNKWLALD